MRTTLTIDDDLAGLLKQRAREQGIPVKEAVNRTIRAGLGETPKARRAAWRADITRPGSQHERVRGVVVAPPRLVVAPSTIASRLAERKACKGRNRRDCLTFVSGRLQPRGAPSHAIYSQRA